MVELMDLEQCLEILMDSNSQNFIIEANLELITRATKKICNGSSLDKVSKQWRLSQVFHRIYTHLQAQRNVSFIHVKRKANMLADHLANEGVINKERDTRHVWEMLPPGKLLEDCLCQAAKDRDRWIDKMDRGGSEDRREDRET